MARHVIKWEYDRRPKTELYDGKLKAYQLLPDQTLEMPAVRMDTFQGVAMAWMLEAVNEFLLSYPTADVVVTRTQPANQFHDERKMTAMLPRQLTELIRDNVLEARKQFEPVTVRSEETNASQR